jgi:predicted permease
VLVALLALALAAGVAGFTFARRTGPRPWPDRVLRTLFWTGAPLAGTVATTTRFDGGLAWGLAAGWLALLGSLALVLVRTRGNAGPVRAETVLAVCWPNTAWIGYPAVVVVFGWEALPLAIAFSQLCASPFTQVVLPSVAASLTRGAELRARVRAAAANPYMGALATGYGLAFAGVALPAALTTTASWLLIASSVPAFAAVGASIARHPLRVDPASLRLVAARLTVASLPLLALRGIMPVPAPFVLAAGMSVGMNTVTVAAAYRVPTRRLAPALALSTAVVLVAIGAVAVLRV